MYISVVAVSLNKKILSTLHTNDAPTAVTRLAEMGIEPFLISSSLMGVLAQRLVRRICERCKEPYEPDLEAVRRAGFEVAEGETPVFYRGKGCDACRGTGYRGRIGVFEALWMDADLSERIAAGANEHELTLAAKHYTRLSDDARVKVLTGLTSLAEARPFLHVSGRFGTERGCLALMWPLAMHPRNKNELLAWDLAQDPAQLADLTPEQARLRLFTASAQLPEGVTRLPVKGVHLNKSPIVIRNLKTLAPERAERFGIDFSVAERHAQAARALPDLSALWEAVYARREEGGEPPVAEEDLYGGFVGDADRRRLARLRGMGAQELAHARTGFDDPRLADLLFRYRARNFAESLNTEERARWDAWCYQRLVQGQGGARTLEGLQAQVDALSDRADERGELILGALIDWADALAPEG